ncbi:cell division protein FtsK [Bifidobacterium goeldii]|uniref:Cell division protein FtsK n=1 Tax=Bifidobacterium goeldii TaxID=2306975 RepID=A0A430FN98_9BIFI|nr:FtsK/SpoIIIE domain-containing protein [Bifidobacterium goeldii]RSX54296.1 cell division protein FtsK [Bifidobacterium goeldii]
MAAVTLATLRERIAKQCEELKRVHAQYLGALESWSTREAQAQEARTRKAKADAKRQLMVAKIRATDAITSAVADAASRAKSLTEPKIDNPALRVAEYVELGRFRIDGRKADVNDDISMPLIAPLLGHGNIVVTGDNPQAEGFVRAIIATAIEHTEPNQLQLVAYDPSYRTPLAPFSALAQEDQNMVRTVQAASGMGANGLNGIIDECSETLQRVGNILQGAETTLVSYRKKVGMPVEQYTLVTLYDYPGEIREEEHRRLMKLIAEAPRYGISFIIRIADPTKLPEWCSLSEIQTLGTSFDLTHRTPTWNISNTFPIELRTLSATEAAQVAAKVAESAHNLRLPIVDFNEVQPKHDWGMSTANGITFALGREGIANAEITIGDERSQKHNILVTGAVGQGKSNLLKVMIYSMCSRYSPDELELYLLDFKDGVTLAPMAPSRNSPAFLPQARILGLQADQNFGFAVLDYMRKEIERRSRLFKQVDVDNIAKYRAKRPNERMPRIVVIIDEFQMLLKGGNSDLNSEAAAKLEEDVRLGRAYGIHVILASQTITGIQALANSADNLFGQFPIRIGLKNSPEQAQATFVQGNLAAARLHYRGQAIVNYDYGALDSNHTIMVAMAKDDQLNNLQEQWYKRVKDSTTGPMVFDGTKPADLASDLIDLQRDGRLGGRVTRAYLGRPVAVDPNPVSFKIDDGMGRHIAVIGNGVSPNALDDDQDNNMGIGLLEATGLSLAASCVPGSAKFVIIDCLIDRDREFNHVEEWIQAMKDLGHDVEVVKKRDAIRWFDKADQLLMQHRESDPPMYVMVFAIERSGDFDHKPMPLPFETATAPVVPAASSMFPDSGLSVAANNLDLSWDDNISSPSNAPSTNGASSSDLGAGSSDLGFGSSDLGFGSSDLGAGSSDLGAGSSDLGIGSSNLTGSSTNPAGSTNLAGSSNPADTTSSASSSLNSSLNAGMNVYSNEPTPREKLFKLLSTGSMVNIHMFIWWSNATGYETFMQNGLGPTGAFDGKILLYGTHEQAIRIDSPTSAWNGAENRALYKDVEGMTSAAIMIPYQPLNPQQLRDLVKELRDAR